MAGGLPLSGVLGRAEIMDAPGDSAIGGTYVGNPVACVAALGAIETMKADDLAGRARQIETLFRERLTVLQEQYGVIAEIRGRGAMLAIELTRGRDDLTPAPELVAAINKYCHSQGLVTLGAGTFGNVIRFLPPLVCPDDLLHEGLDIVAAAFADVS